jgi:hypothetical protein
LERVRIGRLADLLEHWVEGLGRLRVGQLRRQSLERLHESQKRMGIGCLADLLEHWVERLTGLDVGRLHRQRLNRLRESQKRVGIGRLAHLPEHWVERFACLRVGQLRRQRFKRRREGLERFRIGGGWKPVDRRLEQLCQLVRGQRSNRSEKLRQTDGSADHLVGAARNDHYKISLHRLIGVRELPQCVTLPRGQGLIELYAEVVVDRFRESLISAIKLELNLISLIVGVAGKAEREHEAKGQARRERVTAPSRRSSALLDESLRLFGRGRHAFRHRRDPAFCFFEQGRAQQQSIRPIRGGPLSRCLAEFGVLPDPGDVRPQRLNEPVRAPLEPRFVIEENVVEFRKRRGNRLVVNAAIDDRRKALVERGGKIDFF